MYSRAARLVREQKVGKGWQCSRWERAGRWRRGGVRTLEGRERKKNHRKREGGKGRGLERRAHSASVEGGGRREGVLKEGEAWGEQARKEAEGEWKRKIERDERAVCMHRSFISQRSRGKKGEKVSRVCYAKWRWPGRIIIVPSCRDSHTSGESMKGIYRWKCVALIIQRHPRLSRNRYVDGGDA